MAKSTEELNRYTSLTHSPYIYMHTLSSRIYKLKSAYTHVEISLYRGIWLQVRLVLMRGPGQGAASPPLYRQIV